MHVARPQVQGGGPLVALNRVVQMTQMHRVACRPACSAGNEVPAAAGHGDA